MKFNETGLLIIEQRKSDATLTLRDIGKNVGVSPQRVQQVLKRANLTSYAIMPRKGYECERCGETYYLALDHSSLKYCPLCKKIVQRSRLIIVTCIVCGQIRYRKPSYLTVIQAGNGKVREHYFCSRKCLGSYIGNHYGFIAHPDNVAKNERHHDWGKVWKTHLETGLSGKLLGNLLHIKAATVSSILHELRKIPENRNQEQKALNRLSHI